MKQLKRTGYAFLGLFFILLATEVGQQLSVPGVHSAMESADARVGRPLTPVSVAGVARRSVRRCAVGVYRC